MLKKKEKVIVEEVIDIPVENEVMSDAKRAFAQIIEEYKVKNPTKYAMKEKSFLKKLNTL